PLAFDEGLQRAGLTVLSGRYVRLITILGVPRHGHAHGFALVLCLRCILQHPAGLRIVGWCGSSVGVEAIIVGVGHRDVSGLRQLLPGKALVPLALHESVPAAGWTIRRRHRRLRPVAVVGAGRHADADDLLLLQRGVRQNVRTVVVDRVIDAHAGVEAVVVELGDRQITNAGNRDPEERSPPVPLHERREPGTKPEARRLRERQLGFDVLGYRQPALQESAADDSLLPRQTAQVERAWTDSVLLDEPGGGALLEAARCALLHEG